MLEALVRPFQRPDLFSRPRLIAARGKDAVSSAVISWGAAGDVPSATQIDSVPSDPTNFQLRTCNDRFTETTRTTSRQRVSNPNDASQFVDFDRVETISFQKDETGRTASDKVAVAYTTSWSIGSDFHVVFDDNKRCDSRYALRN